MKNGCVYVCKKDETKQVFMFANTSKDDEHAYSLLIEYTPNAKYPLVYGNAVGPKLIMDGLRTADLEELADFFDEAQKNDYAYDKKNRKWTSVSETSTSVSNDNNIVFNSAFKFVEKNGVYEFIVADDAHGGYSSIIGEVETINGNKAKLSAWAFSGEPQKVRGECEIIITNCNVLEKKKWYAFMNAYVHELYEKSKFNCNDIEESDRLNNKLKDVKHLFAKRIIEDATQFETSIVKKDSKLYVFPRPSDTLFVNLPEAYCEVTEVVSSMSQYGPEHVFGYGIIMEFRDYEDAVKEVKEKYEKRKEEEAAEQQMTDVYHIPVDLDADKKEEYTDDPESVFPQLFEDGRTAAESISIQDDRQYIIIVPKDNNKAEMTLTDDPHTVLHSRHLIGREVVVYGPLSGKYVTITDALITGELV